ncbi:MAG: radical SAM protein [Candidatus Woesearchaeota archaeon]
MKKPEILLIYPPPYRKAYYERPDTPHGMLQIATFLKKEGYHVETKNLLSMNYGLYGALLTLYLFVGYAGKKILHLDIKNKLKYRFYVAKHFHLKSGFIPHKDIIGFSILSYWQFYPAVAMARKIKRVSNAKIVFGGAFFKTIRKGSKLYNAVSKLILEGTIDFVVTTDGELPLLMLVRHLEGRTCLDKVPSIVYNDNGIIKSTKEKVLPIDRVPLPDYSSLCVSSDGKPQKHLFYSFIRGCKLRCSFCERPHMDNFEQKKIELVISDLKQLEKQRPQLVSFRNNALNYDASYAEMLCDEMIKQNISIKWFSSVIPYKLTMRLLRKMRTAGCEYIDIGVETGSEKLLRSMGKRFTIKQIETIIKNCNKLGIKVGVHLMIGYPHETEQDFKKTLSFLKRNHERLWRILFNVFILKEKSLIYQNPHKYGIRLRGNDEMFDEIGGLTWEEKIKQNERFCLILLKERKNFKCEFYFESESYFFKPPKFLSFLRSYKKCIWFT